MIRHTVVFKLKHPSGSVLEREFLSAVLDLASIPNMTRFECLRQVSPKNKFDFGLSMEFGNQADYDAYNVHPRHVAFVEQRWKPEVSDFLEIDYATINSI
jgi:Stress responsive A/B Barrel Domain